MMPRSSCVPTHQPMAQPADDEHEQAGEQEAARERRRLVEPEQCHRCAADPAPRSPHARGRAAAGPPGRRPGGAGRSEFVEGL